MSLPGVAAMALMLTASLGPATAEPLPENQLRASFIYRFTQFTQWPTEPEGMVTLCAAGMGGGEDALRALNGRAVGGLPLRFRAVETPREAVSLCQVLVLGHAELATLRRWVQGLSDAPVLTVGVNSEALRAGVCIALLAEPQGLAFAINHSEAKRRGLALSGQMLKLAREVR